MTVTATLTRKDKTIKAVIRQDATDIPLVIGKKYRYGTGPMWTVSNVELSYDQILSRDVPTIIEHSKNWARQGICAPIEIFYRREAIAGQSMATTFDMTDEGWKHTGITIPCNIPYTSYYGYLAHRLTAIPLWA